MRGVAGSELNSQDRQPKPRALPVYRVCVFGFRGSGLGVRDSGARNQKKVGLRVLRVLGF